MFIDRYNIINKLNKINQMTDTLQTIIKAVEQNSDNAFGLIEKVNAFYNSAWDKLILVGILCLGIVGVLVPIVVQWYQKKALKASEENLKKDIERQSLKIKKEILADINKTIAERMKDFEKKIEKYHASTTAMAYHLQGNSSLEKNLFALALLDYVTAAQNYLQCEDYLNLQTVLQTISTFCVNLSQEEINQLKTIHDCDLDLILNNITTKDEKGIFRKEISNIRYTLSKLPKTTKERSSQTI